MPQMAPYNWMILFIMFNMMMMIYLSYNNFLKIPNINKKMKYMNKFSWKW